MKRVSSCSRSTLVLAASGLSLLILAGCERPGHETVQLGYRGLGMEEVENPRLLSEKVAENIPPEPEPPAAPVPTKASQVYQNVQVLGDLSITEFNRLMLAISKWLVADLPEAERCNYCHEPNNLASDAKYQKVVSRSMLQMTMQTNSAWKNHVADTGVTCWTCHRGNAVPEYVWSTVPEDNIPSRLASAGQNKASPTVAYASLPYDPLTPFLDQDNQIGVITLEALPPRGPGGRTSIKQAEWTYGLMMHVSDSLGVNCTFCHNSRSFVSWDQSTQQRTTAWYAIRHVREINQDYIWPLVDILPEYRKGPTGDPLKVGCATCHQGAYKPLYGASMLQHYPSLAGPPPGASEGGAGEEPAGMTQASNEAPPSVALQK